MELSNRLKPQDLRAGRVHEVCGTSALSFAAMIAGQRCGPVIWIEKAFMSERLCPQGLATFFDPARLVVVRPVDGKETLWCMEESLRAAPSMVVARLGTAAGLTESRRLQLAAEVGQSVGLCLIPDAAISNTAETRWRSTALPFAAQTSLHQWELLKNKKGILGQWQVAWDDTARNLIVVSASGGRTGASQQQRDQPQDTIRSGRDAKKRLAALLDQQSG